MKFRKYEFESKEQFDFFVKKSTFEVNGSTQEFWEGKTVVEIGHIMLTPPVLGDDIEIITAATYAPNYSADILFNEGNNEYEDLVEYEVWPDPVGVHTFAGLDYLYEEDYYLKYPEKKPTHPEI
jgi:hypothetical protein